MANRLLKRILTIAVLGACLTSGQAFSMQTVPQDRSPESETLTERNTVVLRGLDKVTARITEIELKVGDEYRFGTLVLTAKYCRTRPPIEPPETFAFLEIDEEKNERRTRVFSGWMVASSPALNALEHPVYDVWVISCKAAEPDSDVSVARKSAS